MIKQLLYKLITKTSAAIRPKTKVFIIEMHVVRDVNTVVHKFIAEIEAFSKNHARWIVKNRLRLKSTLTVKKSTFLKHR